MESLGSWVWLALPGAAALGVWCAALALAYARHIAEGFAIDGATLRAALRVVTQGRSGWAVPWPLGLVCACLLALACLPFIWQPSLLPAARFVACAVLLVLAVIDIRCGLLPDALTLPLLWAGLLLSWAGFGVALHDAVAAAAAGYAFLRGTDTLFQWWRGYPGMGGGDMKLLAALGAWLGWEWLPQGLLAACLVGILFAVLRRGGGGRHRPLAFGPFLAFAGAYGLLGGPVVQFLF